MATLLGIDHRGVMIVARFGVPASILLIGCGAFVGRTQHHSRPDAALLRHLIADVDSVPAAFGPASPDSRLYFDYRPLRVAPRDAPEPGDSLFAATTPSATRTRIYVIRASGHDTVTTSRWSRCPSVLMPNVSRDACPEASMVIFAFSDTFTLHPGQMGAAATPQLVVAVRRTTLSWAGWNAATGYLALAPSDRGWRTVRRIMIGIEE